jgi:hypothetical protein
MEYTTAYMDHVLKIRSIMKKAEQFPSRTMLNKK